jgi:sugar phosphate isomerase/epimerase
MATATCVAPLAQMRPGWAATATANQEARAARVRWVPGLQLYTLGLTAHDDIPGIFKQLAAMGYREVEFAGHYGRSAADLRRALDAAHLRAPAAHVSLLSSTSNWDLTGDASSLAASLDTLGATYAVLPMPLLPDRILNVLLHPPAGFDEAAAARVWASLEPDDWKRTADVLNEKGAALAKHGKRLAYHNHSLEFEPLPGQANDHTNGLRILLERTDPKLVDFELDIGWAVSAGQDLPALFSQVGKRMRLLHLKDTKRVGAHQMDLASTDIGTGIVNWNALPALVAHSPIEHMFVEQEKPFAATPMEAAQVDYQFLTKLFA